MVSTRARAPQTISGSPKGQGTIEYLVIVAVVVVISLVVVSLFSGVLGSSGSGAVVSVGKLNSLGGGSISVNESVLDSESKGVVSLVNNSGENISVSEITVGGVENNDYEDFVWVSGGARVFSFSALSGNCSCIGMEGKQVSCELVMVVVSSSGLSKSLYSSSFVFDCVDQVQPKGTVVSANFCGEDSVVGTEVTACGTISSSGSYTLTQNLSSEGDCLTITDDDVTIYGNNCKVTGNINAGGAAEMESGFSGFVLNDINVYGNIYSNGGPGGSGGDINLLNSYALAVSASGAGIGYDCTPSCGGDTYGGPGGNIYLNNSQVSSISASGGGAGGSGDHTSGGPGGSVILVSSTVLGDITAVASGGYANASGGRLEISGATSTVTGTAYAEGFINQGGAYSPGTILFYSPCPSFDNIGVLSCGDDGSCAEECS